MSNKIYMFILSVLMAACTVDRLEDGSAAEPTGTQLTGVIVDADATKVRLSAGDDRWSLLWQDWDTIGVFVDYSTRPVPFYCVMSQKTESATGQFHGERRGCSYIAKYPYNPLDTYYADTVFTDLPRNQTYTEGSFDKKAVMMAARCGEERILQFHNLCSIIHIPLTGKYPISYIDIVGNDDDDNLGGKAVILFDKDGYPSLQKRYYSITNNDRIRYYCNGLHLDEYEATDCYIVVPPGLYKKGLSISILSVYGTVSKTTGMNLKLEPSRLYHLPCIDFKLFGGYTPSSFLEGKGTEESPFLIESVEDFLAFQAGVNGSTSITSSSDSSSRDANQACYRLMADLDLSCICGPQIGNFSSIGYNGVSVFTHNGTWFNGVFDGGGHTISGIYFNDPSVNQMAMFGQLTGTIRNLNVKVDITAGEYAAGLVSICRGYVENCSVHGIVRSVTSYGSYQREAAGVVAFCAMDGKHISGCDNYASVTGDGLCAGIFCKGISRISNCRNFGEITGECAGGIACDLGYIYSGTNSFLMNCENFGKVSSFGTDPSNTNKNVAGGIVAILSQNIPVSNCLNASEVSAKTFWAGGIAGWIENDDGNKLTNCLSIGNVTCENGEAGALCGRLEGFLQLCYWLRGDDSQPACGIVSGENKLSGVYGLDSAQMAGKAETGALYTDLQGTSFSSVNESLNAWAYDNYSSETPYCGWTYNGKDAFPVLSYEAPIKSGGSSSIFMTNCKSQKFNHHAYTFSIIVTSNVDYGCTCPDWVKSESVTKTEKEGITNTVHTFSVGKNDSGADRSGVICFTASNGAMQSVQIYQSYLYTSSDYSGNEFVGRKQEATRGKGIDLVIMGDGFSDRQIASGLYDSYMDKATEAFFELEPAKSFRDCFNVTYVRLVSENEGFGKGHSTALSCFFGKGTKVGGDNDKCRTLARRAIGKSDSDETLVIVVMNQREYAGTCYIYFEKESDFGSGFAVAYVPLGISDGGTMGFSTILQHEALGHGFGKLADEYGYQSNGEASDTVRLELSTFQAKYGWFRNVSPTKDPFSVGWASFLTDGRYDAENLGVYEGAETYVKGIWRPSENSLMRHNIKYLNAPSREIIYYRIHKLAYGEDWKYDREEFVSYDQKNIPESSKASYMPEWGMGVNEKDFIPLAQPVLIKQ